ncbi:MAG: 2-polyprenyl-3-methyl-6-methoxy-1,4-benzoquinone monooxygenase [Gammaproteobacteria bacterium]|nr:2-polyprenyl-3-methyl-6-methoxy-1,4-benzoquinone monooxygenase [Gammaproteobacteria bacterium]
MRNLSSVDGAIVRLDAALRAAAGSGSRRGRRSPAQSLPDAPLSAGDKRHAAGLMRVNHTGEVCAQALYVGQASLSRDERTRLAMLEAAREESDHLCWCRERLAELDSVPSRLNFFWFAGSFTMGLAAAALGDDWSLGFVEETERQVVRHLQGHLDELPVHDERSRAIVAVMCDDEARHADKAARQGSAPLPLPIRTLMKMHARVMTKIAYWI